ncbi:peptide/nickel transport system ATP-binding protein [Rhodoligotrophos appendicifer]|uniref:dipeptide ABC transporter ATP-binding protein n=1 Tax=Rhodoligotrophos appendicifer TaxID=987056 RepID=UPI00118578D9|nr:ABC transporter ATP-binding protein [Rhodoligotrophos appendicifer]
MMVDPSIIAQGPHAGTVLVRLQNLTVTYTGMRTPAVKDVSFAIKQGQVVGLVGESGSGKSTVGRQLLSHRGPGLTVAGQVLIDDVDILTLPEGELRKMRGAKIAFVPQNPTTALNPAIRVGAQIAEILSVHRSVADHAEARTRVLDLFRSVGFPQPEHFVDRYPSQLSGGQQQRVTIAMAIACNPDVVVFDEPTTGLDVTTQRQIIDLLLNLKKHARMTMLYITHDLLLLRELADVIGVMYAGQLLEIGGVDEVFDTPLHPYTQGLLASVPGIEANRYPKLRGITERAQAPDGGCPFAPRCEYVEVRCTTPAFACRSSASALMEHHAQCWKVGELLFAEAHPGAGLDSNRLVPQNIEPAVLHIDSLSVRYAPTGFFRREDGVAAVESASLSVGRGEILALIGESGSGKSSLARAICGAAPVVSGTVHLNNELVSRKLSGRTREQIRRLQYIFQNPDASLNPRMTIRATLERPLGTLFGIWGQTAEPKIGSILDEVGLDRKFATRMPGELSGGERQRVAIARALLAEPDILICDEVLSALDVSVQARVLDLFAALRTSRNLALLFISHDLTTVRQIADRIAVMYRGRIVSHGPTHAMLDGPAHPYVASLLASAPGMARKVESKPLAPSAIPVPEACQFFDRCDHRMPGLCDRVPPPLRRTPLGSEVLCQLAPEEMPMPSRPMG